MTTLLAIAIRNLARYRRRTLLTASLVALGVLAVVVFSAAAGAFKGLMVGQITDAMLGHLQIHRRGYVASIDSLPLTRMLSPRDVQAIEARLRAHPEIDAYSRRLKFGAMFSSYTETTAIRLNGIYPDEELRTVPLLASRVTQGTPTLSGDDYLLGLKAKTTAVAYDRLKMRVTRKETLPTRIECFAASGTLIKTLHFRDIKDFGGGIVRPAVVETDSPLYRGYKSSMMFLQMRARSVPPEVFTLTFMPNLESIRR